MIEGFIAKKWGDKMFEKDIAKVVRSHARWAAIIVALPMFGFEMIFFVWILWHMYSKLCRKAGTVLTFGNIALGFVVNFVIAFDADALLTFIPVFGWLTTAAIVYLQFYFSGKAFIETLRKKQS